MIRHHCLRAGVLLRHRHGGACGQLRAAGQSHARAQQLLLAKPQATLLQQPGPALEEEQAAAQGATEPAAAAGRQATAELPHPRRAVKLPS